MTETAGKNLAAAIDIGSNSVKMTVGRPDGRGGVEQLAWASDVVRLGEGAAATGRLDQRRIDAALETLRRFEDQARALGATQIVAVATEATRAASNGSDFIARVHNETGIEVRLISGDEEADLTFRGLASELDLMGEVIVADIGGGSTELIGARNGTMVSARSIALGSGRLTERRVRDDPPTAEELAASEEESASVVEEALRELGLPLARGVRLVLVGGTGEYLMRLLPEGHPADLAGVRTVLGDLTAHTAAELAERIGVPEARARVLPAGVAIVAAIAERVKPEAIEIAHSGVRAGLLRELFASTEEARAGQAPRNAKARGRAARPKSAGRGAARPAETPAAPEADFHDTMQALIAERWEAVWNAIPVALAGEDIEGVHDVRVASRRLRAAMDIAAPMFPRPWYKKLHRAAKEITGALGEVRDRDVLLEALRADRAVAPTVEHPGIDRLIERVERERVVARMGMESFLDGLLDGPVRGDVERRFGSRSVKPHPKMDSGTQRA